MQNEEVKRIDRVAQCIRALSNIEGYLLKNSDTPGVVGDHIDYVFDFLKEEFEKEVKIKGFSL